MTTDASIRNCCPHRGRQAEQPFKAGKVVPPVIAGRTTGRAKPTCYLPAPEGDDSNAKQQGCLANRDELHGDFFRNLLLATTGA